MTMVSSFGGLFGPRNFDLVMLSFQVPANGNGSAAKSEPANKNTVNGYKALLFTPLPPCLCRWSADLPIWFRRLTQVLTKQVLMSRVCSYLKNPWCLRYPVVICQPEKRSAKSDGKSFSVVDTAKRSYVLAVVALST